MRVNNRQEGARVVSFSGISGVGKTSFVNLAARILKEEARVERVAVFSENEHDPIRELTSAVGRWLKESNDGSLADEQILGVLFAVGRGLVRDALQTLRQEHEIVILDRCLWDNVAYQAEPGGLTEKEIFDLNCRLGVRPPDLAVIIDGEIENCLRRRKLRDKRVVGTAGQMAGDYEKRQRIKERFLKLPELFPDCRIEVVANPGEPTADEEQRERQTRENIRKLVWPLFLQHGII